MSEDVEFCLLAERGILEGQAVLLCESIRAFAGRYAKSRITVLSPRASRRPSSETVARFSTLGVNYVELDLSSAVPEYGPSYRVLGLGWLGNQPGPAILVQLDSDTIFVDEPDLTLGEHFAAARPVDLVGMCSTGRNDPADDLWAAMCRANAIDVSELGTVRTTVDGANVRASYNGGLLVARREAYALIEECFLGIVAAGLCSYPGANAGMKIGAGHVSAKGFEMWGTSQAAITIAAAIAKAPVHTLDDGHNVPLHLFEFYDGPSSRLAHLHYHWLFNDRSGVDKVLASPLKLSAEQRSWLRERLPLALRTREGAGVFSPQPFHAASTDPSLVDADRAVTCSVVMTTYNDFRFLREAVESVLRQDFEDFELIVVDDGSDDQTAIDWLPALDPRIRLLKNPRNVGTAVSANRGIEAARGEIIVRLDSDDVAEPSRLGKLVEALRADPELGMVGSAVTIIDESGHAVGVQEMPQSDFEIRWTLLFHNPFYHSAVAFRRECFDKAGGYRADQLVSLDHYLWFDMLPFCRARNLVERLVRYRINSKGLTATHASDDPRRRTDPIRVALWRDIGLAYEPDDKQRALDMSELLRGPEIADATRRKLAGETILSTLSRVIALRKEFMRETDEAAADRMAGVLKGRIARSYGRAHGRLARAWRSSRTIGLRATARLALSRWRTLRDRRKIAPTVAASGGAASLRKPLDPLVALLHQVSPYEGFDPGTVAADSQGWGSEAPIFAEIIAAVRPRVIVEVGSWKGASAIHMARVAQSLGLDTRVICVDTWLGSTEHFLGERPAWRESLRLRNGYPSLYFTFLGNVVRAGLADRIVPLPNTSDNAAFILRARGIVPDLVYIDGAHQEDAVYRDLRNYWELLAPDGVLVGDDYHIEDVQCSADRFAAAVDRPLTCDGGKFVIWRKTTPHSTAKASR